MGSNYEQLGAFYLGRRFDEQSGEVVPEPILYDAKDLTTHAVCVGMTGSGKTGLGVVLLEEAAIDGIPILAIDPKGDLGNLLLTFPNLEPREFEPWVDGGEAARKGRTPAEHADFLARLWRKGLADWDQSPDRISRYADSVERTIYTPGSRSGVPLAVLRSFDAPPEVVRADEELLRDRIQAAVSGLLALLGIEGDPIRSREHILLSTILENAWREGRDLDLPALIHEIQSPQFDKIGVFGLESFFDTDDRFELAVTLNNLIASPGFSVWTEGEPLDIQKLLYTDQGKPRLSILSIAHLDDSERMFFVTAFLNELLTWTRSQPGTRSLRAILYMDEIFGYFPPTANPPSKRPMLTLLKQARAYGVGVVLATQNPVDLDYKGLSNTGTWFLGRLQTERDKARIIDGLEGAAVGSNFDRNRMEKLISGLDSRVFLMNNVHEDSPVLFHTRWALSYLGGPLTRSQIGTLMAGREPRVSNVSANASSTPTAKEQVGRIKPAPRAPELPPGVPQCFVDLGTARQSDERLVYRPALFARATLHHSNARLEVDEWSECALLAPARDRLGVKVWAEAALLDSAVTRTKDVPEPKCEFGPLPAALKDPKNYARLSKTLKTHLYATQAITLWRCKALKAKSRVGESEGEFQARLSDLVRERRDLAVEKLRARYAPRLARVEEQIRAAQVQVEKQQAQKKQAGMSTAINVGTTLLGALFGRKLSSTSVRGAGTAMRSAGRVQREARDIEHAQEKVAALGEKVALLEEELAAKLDAVRAENSVENFPLEPVRLAPRKSDITVDGLWLAWTPWIVDANGIAESAF